MLNMKNVLIFGLILSFFIVGCGQDQGQPTSESVSEQTGSMLDEGKKMIQQAEQEALQLKETVVKQAGEIADKAGAIKDNTAAIVADLIANANTSLNMGRFNDAISSAKEVLTNYDGNSQKAKDIIKAYFSADGDGAMKKRSDLFHFPCFDIHDDQVEQFDSYPEGGQLKRITDLRVFQKSGAAVNIAVESAINGSTADKEKIKREIFIVILKNDRWGIMARSAL